MNKERITYFSIGAVLASILVYFQFEISINIPWWDDFHGIMLPVYDAVSDLTLKEKLISFFAQNNEHRIAVDRFFMLLVYLITGSFNLKVLAILGFLNLVGIALIFTNLGFKSINKSFYLLPVLFIIFQAQYYESLQSLMVPFQNFSVILFSLLAIYSISFKKNNNLITTFLYSVLALFSHGNGLVVFVVIGILFLLKNENKKFGIWSLCSVLMILLYFLNYEKPSWVNTSQGADVTLFQKTLYSFQFIGAFFQIPFDAFSRTENSIIKVYFSSILGLFLVVSFLYLFVKKYRLFNVSIKDSLEKFQSNHKDQFVLGGLLFFLATAILMGANRADLPMFSRYTINSAFILVFWYLFVLDNLSSKLKFSIFFIGLSVCFWSLSYFNYTSKALNNKFYTEIDGLNWQNTGSWVAQYTDSSHVKRLNPLLKPIYNKGMYHFPISKWEEFSNFEKKENKPNVKIEIREPYLYIFSKGDNSCISLEAENLKYLVPLNKKRQDLQKSIISLKYYSGDLETYFPKNNIPKGNYKVFLNELNGDIKSRSFIKEIDL